MEKIKISTNRKEYQICDENDNELGVIKVDVTDFNFFARTKETEAVVEKTLRELEELAAKEISNEDNLMEFTKLDEKIKKQLNYMFDYDVSSVVFGNQHCLSLGNGELFLERFMTAIVPVIKNDIAKEQRKSKQKISKYTKGYVK